MLAFISVVKPAICAIALFSCSKSESCLISIPLVFGPLVARGNPATLAISYSSGFAALAIWYSGSLAALIFSCSGGLTALVVCCSGTRLLWVIWLLWQPSRGRNFINSFHYPQNLFQLSELKPPLDIDQHKQSR